MGISRPTVAKLLAHGRARGFVTVEIHDPRDDASELASRLEERFGLACARVAHGHAADRGGGHRPGGARRRRSGGSAGARRHERGDLVGAHDERARLPPGACASPGCARRPAQGRDLLFGAGDARLRDHAFLLRGVVRRAQVPAAARHFRGHRHGSRSCGRDRAIARILEEGRGVDVAVFTVGAIRRGGPVAEPGPAGGRARWRRCCATPSGDACSRFFTRDGAVAARRGRSQRTVGIRLEELRARPVRVLVAGGRVKAERAGHRAAHGVGHASRGRPGPGRSRCWRRQGEASPSVGG